MITAKLFGEVQFKLKLGLATPRTNKAIEDFIKRAAIRIVAYVKANKLSDQVLHVRTGRLRRSITARFEGAGTDNFRAYVGTNVKYARAHENGFNGTVEVPEHKVKAFQRMQSTAFGRAIEPRMVDVREHVVKAHSMKMNMPARPFLHPSLEENAEYIRNGLRDAVARALKESRA